MTDFVRRDLTLSERCERTFSPNWKDPREAEEARAVTVPKGSVAHQIEMAVVRETPRKAVVPPEAEELEIDDDGVDGIHRFTCDECRGSGREWEGWPCDTCGGTGYLDV